MQCAGLGVQVFLLVGVVVRGKKIINIIYNMLVIKNGGKLRGVAIVKRRIMYIMYSLL